MSDPGSYTDKNGMIRSHETHEVLGHEGGGMCWTGAYMSVMEGKLPPTELPPSMRPSPQELAKARGQEVDD